MERKSKDRQRKRKLDDDNDSDEPVAKRSKKTKAHKAPKCSGCEKKYDRSCECTESDDCCDACIEYICIGCGNKACFDCLLYLDNERFCKPCFKRTCRSTDPQTVPTVREVLHADALVRESKTKPDIVKDRKVIDQFPCTFLAWKYCLVGKKLFDDLKEEAIPRRFAEFVKMACKEPISRRRIADQMGPDGFNINPISGLSDAAYEQADAVVKALLKDGILNDKYGEVKKSSSKKDKSKKKSRAETDESDSDD